MHQDEITVSTALAIRLVDAQMPEWAGLPVRPLSATGADNWMFRLGHDKLLRFPRRPSATLLLKREWEWLPHMRSLPLAVPEPLSLGEPDHGYPCPWMALKWIPGDPARLTPMGASVEAAETLGNFVTELRALPGAGGPIAGSANHNRGVPLSVLDESARRTIAEVRDLYASTDLLDIWDSARREHDWSGAPIWLHGDLSESNLLTLDGKLGAVIDFGLMARGDPAVDLIPAWNMFEGAARARYVDAVGLDDETVSRGRGWALYAAVIALSYYRNRNPVLARQSHRTLGALLDE